MRSTVSGNLESLVSNEVISGGRGKTLPANVRKRADSMAEETSNRACAIAQAGEEADRTRLKQAGVDLVTLSAGDKAIIRQNMSGVNRSEEHTSELQSLMRISYAVFCLKKKKIKKR